MYRNVLVEPDLLPTSAQRFARGCASLDRGARRGCDLVVIGTRGRLDTLGLIAEQVVRISDRPVLVVPPSPGAEGMPP